MTNSAEQSMLLVTGSSGQLGSYVVDGAPAVGMVPVGLDLRPSPWTQLVQNVLDVYRGPAPKAIVHCAAQVSVARSVETPRFDAENNVVGTVAALDLARANDARFVFISSAAIYGTSAAVPTLESSPAEPISPYGLSKAVGERYVAMYRALYGLETVVLRPFNIFSRRQDPSSPYSGVISRFVDRLGRGESLTIHGDGKQTRDFVHASDVVQAIFVALREPGAVGRTFNVGAGRQTSIVEVANTLRALSGRGEVPIEFGPARPGDIRYSCANIGALRALGYAPNTSMTAHLQEMIIE